MGARFRLHLSTHSRKLQPRWLVVAALEIAKNAMPCWLPLQHMLALSSVHRRTKSCYKTSGRCPERVTKQGSWKEIGKTSNHLKDCISATTVKLLVRAKEGRL